MGSFIQCMFVSRGYQDRVYLDLADEQWRVIEVDTNGWRVASDVPVRFLRPAGMMPLPMPEGGGSIEDLRMFMNVEDDFKVIVAFLLGSLRPTGPFAHLELLGEQGSAKSTTARIIRSLIDPNHSPLKVNRAASGISRLPPRTSGCRCGTTCRT
jgi:ABC-type protease/lipase transport system fused ATPase/permease subunit